MSLESRIRRLEQAQEPKKQYRLYSPAGDDLTGAEVITVPTKEREGLALLADGTEKSVIMKDTTFLIFDADILTGELWWTCNDGLMFSFVGTGITAEDLI